MEGNALHFTLRTHVMALYYDLPVFKDVYKLTLLIYSLTKDFSKEYKYTLGQDLKKDVMVLMRSIYRANKAQNKKEYLETFLDDFELLKLEVRLCVDFTSYNEQRRYLLSQIDGVLFWTSDLFEHVQDGRSLRHSLQTCAIRGVSANYLGHASQTRASGGG